MPEDPSADAARRFAADLRALRETRGVSLDRVQAETRVPLGVLQSFEATALDGHALFNRVYIRSLARTYADVVGLTPEIVVAALDGVFEGHYDGALGRPETAPPEPERPTAAPRPPATAEVGDEDLTAVNGFPAFAPVADLPPFGAYEASEFAPEPEPPVSRALDEPPPPADRSEPGSTAPADAFVPAASPALAPPALAPSASEPARFEPAPFEPSGERASRPAWALPLVALVLLALGAGAWWITRDAAPASPVAPSATGGSTSPTRPDTAASVPVASGALPDTLTLVLAAEGAKIQRLRVRVDDGVRRPYWVEIGEQRRVLFLDSAFVYNPAPTTALTVEGRPVPASARRADGVVVLRRADLAAGGAPR